MKKKILIAVLISTVSVVTAAALALKYALPDYLFDSEFDFPQD